MKQYEVHFLAEAVTDLDRLFCYIAEESSFENADRYLARIERLCHSLETFPRRGTEVPGRTSGMRTMGFEHRVTILFRVGEQQVDILRILGKGSGRAIGKAMRIQPRLWMISATIRARDMSQREIKVYESHEKRDS